MGKLIKIRFGRITRPQRRPAQVQDERGNAGIPSPDAESQEFGPCPSGSQESTPEQSLQNTPTTPYPITESNRPFSSFFITTNDTDSVDPGHQNQSRQNDQNSEEDKLNLGDDLETLWKNPYFDDELRHALDFTHSSSSKISDCNHLIHEFQIPLEERGMMSCSKESPSEKMLDYIKSSKPLLQISVLRTALRDGNAHKALRSLEKALEDKKCTEDDYVTDVLNKNLMLRTAIILQLDSTGHWKQVSNKLEIPLETSSLFERDSTSNPAETFFQLLWTQSPTKLKVSKLKTHLLDLGQNDLVLKMSDISGEEPLTILRSKPSLMYGVIQPKLNAPNSPLLMILAERFQSEGYLKDVDIQIFKANESYESPTRMMMKYVLCSQEKKYKIQDLVDKLKKIGRFDCCEIVAKYVKDVDFEEIGEANDMANGENVNRAQSQNNDQDRQ